ncbi:hypothetical protein [Mycolicibacterium septicum]|uniref:hypothetical protein n=1 Tax=Mycolicibacterium septicum TaxID=98668 RepID=UPI001F43AFBC|nr:hypothetical protein [Mycolicibacterium septicum]
MLADRLERRGGVSLLGKQHLGGIEDRPHSLEPPTLNRRGASPWVRGFFFEHDSKSCR